MSKRLVPLVTALLATSVFLSACGSDSADNGGEPNFVGDAQVSGAGSGKDGGSADFLNGSYPDYGANEEYNLSNYENLVEYVDAYGTLPDDFLDEIARRINASEAAAIGELPQTLTGPALSNAGQTMCETEDLRFVALKQTEEFGDDNAHVDGLVQDWDPERIEQLSKVIEGVANEIGINRSIDQMRSDDFSTVNFLSAFGGMSHCPQDYSSVALRNSSVVGLLAAEEIPQDEAESVLFSD